MIERFDIVSAMIGYIDIDGGKKRPILIVRLDKDTIYYFKITSQYDNKSAYFQSRYFKIYKWQECGLKKESWVDTTNLFQSDLNTMPIKKIGRLSEYDIKELVAFSRKV